MPFPYSDGEQAESFALGYFQRLRDCDDIHRTWLGLDALVQVRIQQPDIAVSVDTRGGREMRITPGVTAEEPDLTLTLSADSFHEIYAGQLNVFTAVADRKIKTEGNAALLNKRSFPGDPVT